MIDPEIIERLRNAGKGSSHKQGFTGGLFQQKRNSISMLTDTSVVAHLNQLNQTAIFVDQTKDARRQDEPQDEWKKNESSDEERLCLKIAAYNQGRQGAFLITKREMMNYDGALRFYFEDGSKMIAKAFWLTNHTTINDLMPSIRQKFNTMENNRWKPVLYKVQNQDEILLDGEELPLDIAINSKHNLRFILRMEPCLPNTPPAQTSPTKSEYTSTQRKSLTQFFGVESSDLAVPYYATPVPTSPVLKSKQGSPKKRNKKLNSVDSLSLSSNGSSTLSNGSTSGMVLKTQTPKFIKRFQSEGSPRIYAKKGSNGKQSSKGLEPVQRSRAKSLSMIFDRSLGLGKKVPLLRPVSQELSCEESAPGLLKIFGDQICQTSTYKSVLASAQSSAVELVKVVLERYSLPVSTFGDYVLCDVIGNYKTNPEKVSRVLGFSDDFEEKQEWMMECMRVIGDDERPLTIQSFWKPEIGFARRFEIRRRSDIEPREIDTITHEINMNAKWLQLPKEHRISREASSSSLQEDEDKKVLSSSSSDNENDIKETQEDHPQESTNQEPQSSNRMHPMPNPLPPHDRPYLLMLQGSNPETDQILYQLDKSVNHIGRHGNTHTNIQLHSVDVNQDHCRILKQQFPKGELKAGELFAVPVRGSKVLINGSRITKQTQLNSGDVIGIGDQYLFLLRNPLAHQTKESALMRLLSLLGQTSSYSVDTPETEKELPFTFPNQNLAAKAEEYSKDSQRLKISYPLHKEDEVLREIASLLPSSLGFSNGDVASLSMSYMMCMCVEYSAYNFHTENTHRLMLKVASLIQTLAWDKTKETAANQQEKSTDVQSAVATLFPDIRIIVGLLSNALEILNFLQTHMKDYIVIQEPKSDDNKEESGCACEIQDDTLTELEEVVMYTFQQMVYYLTKTLYIAIPIILDSNPFSDGRDETNNTNSMDSVLSVFQMTFDLMNDLGVHPDIRSQLFAYLFFFTNASLFNMLVERGSSGSFYKWSKGVQIRGNLDALEGWIQSHDLQEQGKFLVRVSTAIALLATPKVQLIQADWKSLQHDFSGLNSTQLHHFLSQYQLGDNQPRPTAWLPPPEEMKASMSTDDILESFDNHPALELPSQGLKMNLKQPISNEHFTQQLHKLKRCLPYITISNGTEDISDIPDRHGNPSIVISDPETTCPTTDDDITDPVPPPRTKSYRLSQSEDADGNTIEVLNRPLEVTQVAPVAVANTVRLPQTDAESKMSPRVFSDTPVLTISDTSKDEESESLADRTDNPNTNNSCDDKTVTSTISMVTAESTLDADVADKEEGLHNDASDCHGNEDKGQRKPQTVISNNSDGTVHLDEYEEPKKPCPTLSSSSTVITIDMGDKNPSLVKRKDSVDDVFIVDLEKGKEGVGLGLIDGMHTPLHSQGIYVRKLVPGGSASQNGRFMIGDRILAVNGTSLVGADYNSAMQMIRTSGTKLRFLVAKSEPSVALKITATSC